MWKKTHQGISPIDNVAAEKNPSFVVVVVLFSAIKPVSCSF